MGMIYTAKCNHCDFKKEFLLGSLMLMHFENDGYECDPALDLRTNEFVSINYLEFRNNPNFKFYNHPDLYSGPPLDQDAERFSFNEHENYCPACKTKNLELFWDLVLVD